MEDKRDYMKFIVINLLIADVVPQKQLPIICFYKFLAIDVLWLHESTR